MPLRNSAMVPSTASRVMIRVERGAAHVMSGLIYNPYMDKIESFSDVLELANKLDAMMDSIAFPQSSTAYRSFKSSKRKRAGAVAEEAGQRGAAQWRTEEREMELKDTLRKQDADVFVVHVQFRQNATWQGTIKWAGQNEELRFRSTLELLKIMDGALGNRDDDPDGQID